MAKILIVEDDVVISRLYTSAFQAEGYEVDTAANGKEGLEKVKVFKPDLILSDIMMPKMDGVEMLKTLKSKKETKNIPVIIMTNLKDEESIETALKLGTVKHILKDDTGPKEVVEIIKEVLSGVS